VAVRVEVFEARHLRIEGEVWTVHGSADAGHGRDAGVDQCDVDAGTGDAVRPRVVRADDLAERVEIEAGERRAAVRPTEVGGHEAGDVLAADVAGRRFLRRDVELGVIRHLEHAGRGSQRGHLVHRHGRAEPVDDGQPAIDAAIHLVDDLVGIGVDARKHADDHVGRAAVAIGAFALVGLAGSRQQQEPGDGTEDGQPAAPCLRVLPPRTLHRPLAPCPVEA